MNIGPQNLMARGATRMRLTLWMLSEGQVRLGSARAWVGTGISMERMIEVTEWQVAFHQRVLQSGPERVRARVVRSDSAMKPSEMPW